MRSCGATPMSSEPVVLPPHWRPWQRRKNNFLYGLIATTLFVMRRVPYVLLVGLGTLAGALGFIVAWGDRTRALRQLRLAMPELRTPRRTIFTLFVHLGRMGAEWLHIGRFTRPGSPHVDWDNFEDLQAALAVGRGALVVVPHIGNWELAAQALARRGVRCTTVAKRLYDPRLTALVEDFRQDSGLRCLWRGDTSVREEMREVLQRGEVLGMLIDQDTKTRGVFVPFFHTVAHTPIIPAELACEAKSEVVFAHGIRVRGRYVIHFERVPRPDTGQLSPDATALTAELSYRIERLVRRVPAQWMWLHRRWRTRPVH